jgi:hypothetical protein
MIISGFSPFNYPAIPTPDRAMEAGVATGCTIMQSFPSFYKVCSWNVVEKFWFDLLVSSLGHSTLIPEHILKHLNIW